MSKEVRDKLAGLEAKMVLDDDGRWINQTNIPDDLNTCAAMWDKYAGADGWEWERYPDTAGWAFYAGKGKRSVHVDCSGTDAASELRDRWALLGEVLKARGVWA